MADQIMSDQNMSEQNMSDQNMSDQNTSDQNTSNQDTSDQDTSDQTTADQSTASPFHPALLIIDMQNDFCHPTRGACPCIGGALHLAPAINSLLQLTGWAIKIATMNNTPEGWIIAKESHPEDVTHADVKNTKKGKEHEVHKQMLWPRFGKKGTWGHEIVGEIERGRIDLVVEKNMHVDVVMQSGFGDTHGNKKHDLPPGAVSHHLDDELRKKDVTHVYCVGTAGDHCVPLTAWDAASFGFKVYIIEDVVANLIDDGGKEFGELKKKAEALGVVYVNMESEEVKRVKDL